MPYTLHSTTAIPPSPTAFTHAKTIAGNITDEVSSNPETIRTVLKASRFFAERAGEVALGKTFGITDNIIGALTSLKVINRIIKFDFKKEGKLGTTEVFLNTLDLGARWTSLGHKLGIYNLGKALFSVSLTGYVLDISCRIIAISKSAIRLVQFKKPAGQLEQLKLEVKAETTTDIKKKAVWLDRLKQFRMKKGETFLNVAFYVSLLAMHVLLLTALLVPGVNLVIALPIVVGVVTALGISKIGLKAAMPTIQPRKYKILKKDPQAVVFNWETGLKKADPKLTAKAV